VKEIGDILLKIVVGSFALIAALSLASFHPLDPYPFSQGATGTPVHNLCGVFGASMAGILQTLVGAGAWLVPVYIFWECFLGDRYKWQQRLAWLLLSLSIWTLLGGLNPRLWQLGNEQQAIELRWGGWIGRLLWPSIRQMLGPIGLPLVTVALICLTILVLAPILTKNIGIMLLQWLKERVLPWAKPISAKWYHTVVNTIKKLLANKDITKKKKHVHEPYVKNAIHKKKQQEKDKEQIAALHKAEREFANYRKESYKSINSHTTVVTCSNLESLDTGNSKSEPITPSLDCSQFAQKVHTLELNATESVNDSYDINTNESLAVTNDQRTGLPPHSIFDLSEPKQHLDLPALEATRLLLQEKFNEFKVKGKVVGLRPGPVVTVYEFEPDPGVPVAKVLNLEEDLALRLEAEKVRIDRISGCNLVGIEIPNHHRETINFREIIDSQIFQRQLQNTTCSLLMMALGKDMAGRPIIADLAKMPHLLIGGSTGSGKSVGVNAMICSILLRALPSEVKLILVDPKMVELGIYEDIPHLWAPVVTDMKEAGRVLRWVVGQMEDRYRRLAMLNVRNIESFNCKIFEAGGSIDLSNRTPNPRWPDRPAILEPLPCIVVVIDELADLMMVCRSEVEDSIARIAQKARAVGIHLILATQRPSVDIVTGVIKANLSSRLSYRVNTKIDSRTILDSSGAEQLLGKGDALFLAPGNARPKRIHAPLITEDETIRLVEWLKKQGTPSYNLELLNAIEKAEDHKNDNNYSSSATTSVTMIDENVYERAVAIVKREQKASTSLLQRKLNIGYGRAARFIDRMENEEIISSDRGAGKAREVFLRNDV
jgi:S-DNA-T family DNA segregation ATPase FtsK/SpoIIIE